MTLRLVLRDKFERKVSRHNISHAGLPPLILMSQPLNSVFLGDPPAKNTRSRQETEQIMAQPPADVAVVNTIVEQLRSMTLNDRLATFESSAHEGNTWLSRFKSTARGKGWTAAVLHTRLPIYLGDNEHGMPSPSNSASIGHHQ